jgi:hypothetical protein
VTKNRNDIKQNKDFFLRSVKYSIRPDFRVYQLSDSAILKVIEDNLSRWEIGEFKNVDSILFYQNLSYSQREEAKIGLNQFFSMDFYLIDKGEFKITFKGEKRFVNFLFTDRSVMLHLIKKASKGLLMFSLLAAFTLLIMDRIYAYFTLIASFSFFGLVIGFKYFFPFLRYKVMIKRIIMREELRINEL